LRNEDLLQEYLDSVRLRQAPSTVASKINFLERYIRFVNKPLAEVNSEDIRRFADSLAEKNFRGHSIHQYICTIRGFHKYLNQRYGHDIPDTSDIRASNRWRRVSEAFKREPLSREEVRKLIEAAKSARDRLVIAVLYYTGLRTSELASLKLDDVDVKKGVVRVVRGKGGRSRWVKYNTGHLGALVDCWLGKERKSYLNAGNTDYFFVSRTGKKLSSKAICEIVRKAAERAGIQEIIGKSADGRPIYRVSSHALRHTFAAHAYWDGVELERIQRLMGYKPSTATIFVEEPLERLFKSYDEHFRGVSTKRKRRRPVSPMVSRHSFATHAKEDGIPLDHIQRMMRHENINTTMIYAKEPYEHLFESYDEKFQGVSTKTSRTFSGVKRHKGGEKA